MKKEYVKPEILYIYGDDILQGGVITEGSETNIFDTNSGVFEEEEDEISPSTFSLWDEGK